MFNTSSLKPLFRPLYVPVISWYYDAFRAPKRYRQLYKNIKNLKAKRILEIGVWNGKRANEMICFAQKSTKNIEYYGFDLFEDLSDEIYHLEISKRPLSELDVKKFLEQTKAKITLFKGNTLNSLPLAVPQLPKMDFVFIDGGHSIETITNDWENVKKLMHDNTVVIFDDYWRNRDDAGCKKIVDAIDRNEFKVEILPEIDTFNNPDFGLLEISFAKVSKK